MTMTELLELGGPFAAGIIGGVLFFGGLWLTVKKGVKRKNPSFLFLTSFILRTSMILSIFYYVSDGNWRRLTACAGGFLVARYVVTYYTGSPQKVDR